MPPVKAHRGNDTHVTPTLGVRLECRVTTAAPGSGNGPAESCHLPQGNAAQSTSRAAHREAPQLPGLPEEAAGFPSLEAFNTRLDGLLCRPPRVTLPGLGAGPDHPHSSLPTVPILCLPSAASAPPKPRRSASRPGSAAHRGGGTERPALTKAKRRAGGRSPAPGAGGAAPSSSPPSGWRGRGEAAHPPAGSGSGGAGTRGERSSGGSAVVAHGPSPRARAAVTARRAGPGPPPRPFPRLTR